MLRPVLWRLAVWGAFLLLGVAAVGVTGLPTGAPGGVFATAARIAREGVPTIGGNTALVGTLDGAARGVGLAYHRGDYWHAQPPGAALVAVPAAWLGVPLADRMGDAGAAVLLVGLTGVFLLVAVAAALAWAGERMAILPRVSLLAAILGTGTLLWPFGTLTNTAVLVALVGVLIAVALADGADARVEAGWTPRGRLFTSGLLVGLLPFVTPFAPVPLVLVPLVLVAWGGRNWWKRAGYVALGLAPPLLAYVALMTVWFGRPWGAAWQYALGEAWQRTFAGQYLATPGLAAADAAGAVFGLVLRHPLLLAGWGGLLLGLAYVPWRTRTTLAALLLSVGVPAFFGRQLPGGVAEEHPVAVLAPFAAAGVLLLAGVVARDRLRATPAVFGGGAALVALGLVTGIVTRGGRTVALPAGANPAVYVVPLALCAVAVLLLSLPAIALPRRRGSGSGRRGGIESDGETTRPMNLGGVALLLVPLLLTACGRPATLPMTELAEPSNLAPPLAVRLDTGVTEAVWRLGGGAMPTADGMALSAGSGPGTATSPRIAVNGGDRYRVTVRVASPAGAANGGTLAATWLDTLGVAISEERVWLEAETARVVAAVPGAAAVRLTLSLVAGATAGDPRLVPLDGGRLDPWPDYRRAAFAFTFDWETAMGGLVHTRGGVREHDVPDAEARALRMRQGAAILRRQLDIYGIKATWYVNGYNLLTGNAARRQFAGNPTYNRYNVANAGFLTDYWARNPWYGDDPHGTEQSHPAWYFGSLTKEFAAGGQDIQSHTFGHLFLAAGITPQQLDDDLTAWDTVAREMGLPPASSFAFPWGASNRLTDEYFAVFAAHGITGVTRFYDTPPGVYELGAVPQRPGIRVLPDGQLIAANEESLTRRGDELFARRGIDLTLAGGGAWSLWTHPESVTTPVAQTLWERVIGYAAGRRDDGLWVVPATQIVSFAEARENLRVTSVRVGEQTTITVTNTGRAAIAGATLTLPRVPTRVTFAGGSGLPDYQGAQVRLGTLGAGQRVTLTVR